MPCDAVPTNVHFTERAAQVDRRRDSELVAAGWTVLRFSGERLRDDPLGVAAEVSAVLAIAGQRASGNVHLTYTDRVSSARVGA